MGSYDRLLLSAQCQLYGSHISARAENSGKRKDRLPHTGVKRAEASAKTEVMCVCVARVLSWFELSWNNL